MDQDTFEKVSKHNTHDSQEVISIPPGDLKAARTDKIAQHIHTSSITSKKHPQKKHHLGIVSEIFTGGLKLVSWRQPLVQMWIKTMYMFLFVCVHFYVR